MNEKNDRYHIGSIDRALDVLETLSQAGTMSLIDLCNDLKVPKSSVYRAITTLENRGYIDRVGRDGKYCIGYKALEITKNLLDGNSLRNAALPQLNYLVETYGDTANLGILDGDEIVYVDLVEGTNALRMNESIGTRGPFYATGLGKAIVAHLSDAKREELISGVQEFCKFTTATIANKEQLQEEFRITRERGYSVDDEENIEGAVCVAAPIFDMYGQVLGSLSLSGAKHRFGSEHIERIISDVTQAARNASMKLGYVPTHRA